MSRWYLTLILLISCTAFPAAEKKQVEKSTLKPFWVNFGAGLPQLASLEASYRILPKWQIGAAYGIIPGGNPNLAPRFSLPAQNIVLANSQFVTFSEPTVTSSLTSICPFVRFFPNPSSFYIQLTMALMWNKNDFESDLNDVNGNKIAEAKYSGVITAIQALPTISIGHVFHSNLFFFNVNMGVSIIANVTVQTAFSSQLPDSLGGDAANQDSLNAIDENSRDAINGAVAEFRKQIQFLPSMNLMFGFMF